MTCTQCGSVIPDNQRFCTRCGTPSSSQPVPAGTHLVGFSPLITHPAFASYRRKSRSWSFLFAGILAVIAIIGFPIYGNTSGEIDWPNSLYYGMGIGGMFLVIALLQTIKRGVDKTWDGVIIDKKSYSRTEHDNDGHTEHHTYYVIKVRKDSGGAKKHKWTDTRGLYDYYNIGDRVRHNKGLYYYEKYDKSHDTQIMCAACMSFNDINQEACVRCKCPLLK